MSVQTAGTYRKVALGAVALIVASLIAGNAANAVPLTVPDAPTSVTATRGNTSATMRWVAPVANGGSALTGYNIVATNGATTKTFTVAPSLLSASISGLKNGSTYSVTINAFNSMGQSVDSETVTVLPSTVAATVPAAPVISAINAKTSRTLTLTYRTGNNNGSTITSTEYSIDGGSTWQPTLGSPLDIENLTNGTTYTVALRSRSYLGFGAVATKVGKPTASKNTILFSTPGAMTYGDPDQALEASALGGTTSFQSLTTPVCTVINGAIHAVSAGSCKIKAINSGDDFYAAAVAVTKSIVIGKAALVINFSALSSIGLNSADQTLFASAPGGVTTLTSSTPKVCTITASGKLHAVSTGLCTVKATNPGNSSYSAASAVTRALTIVSVLSTPTATPTATVTPTPTPTPSRTVGSITLDAADKGPLTIGNTWWRENSNANSIVKYVVAGSTLTLRYTVKDTSGNPVPGIEVTLEKVLSATYSGALVATTSASGVAVFTLLNTNTDANAESFRSDLTAWSDSTSGTVEGDFIPYISSVGTGACYSFENGACARDRVWTHVVRSSALTKIFASFGTGDVIGTTGAGQSFGRGVTSTVASSPRGDKALKFVKGDGDIWSGLNFILDGPNKLTGTGNSRITLDYFSPDSVNSPLELKLMGTGGDPWVRYATNAVPGWNSISVDFSTIAGWSSTAVYKTLVIYVDFTDAAGMAAHVTNTGQIYYIDNVSINGGTSADGAIDPVVSPSATASASASSTATPTATPTGTSYACQADPAQQCGLISNMTLDSEGVPHAVSGSTVTLDGGKNVTFSYVSNAANAGKRMTVTWFNMTAGLSSSVAHNSGSDPWAKSACYPDGANAQCQIMLDASGSGSFTVVFSGNSNGTSFMYKIVGPLYSSEVVTATFTGGPTASPTSSPSSTPTATPSASPTPTPTSSPFVPGTLNLLWADEFSGSSGAAPDSTKWFNTTGDGCAAPDNNCGWGNGERQWYAPSANTVDGSTQGNLLITANRLPTSSNQQCDGSRCWGTSGKMTTNGKAGFTYGYLEARIKGPAGNGNWPAFWMLGTDIYTNPWPRSGEIDIYEVLGSAQTTNWGTAHFADAGGGHIQGPGANTWNTGTNTTQTFHTYGILWRPGSITWYFDGVAKQTLLASSYPTSQWPFGKTASDTPTFYAILNNAMGGQGGAIDSSMNSSTMTVDYVRYYSVDGVGRVTTY